MKVVCQKLFSNLLILLALVIAPIAAFAGAGTPFNDIAFFGDSLTDNGNLYRHDAHYMPRPPYYKGRFSNGEVWSDNTAKYFADKNKVTFGNYAVGGETAVFRNPFNHYLPFSLDESYEDYRFHTAFSDRGNTLLIMWIGSNDYLNGTSYTNDKGEVVRGQTSDDPDVKDATDQVVKKIKDNIQSLIGLGINNVIVVNLPDFSKTPYGIKSDADVAGNLKALTLTHNAKLLAAVAELQNSNKQVNIQMYDLYSMFNLLLTDPKPFTQLQLNITNNKEACWGGGYTGGSSLRRMTPIDATVDANQIAQEYLDYMNKQPRLKAANDKNEITDAQAFGNYVANSPALAETYRVTKLAENGVKQCDNPDNYVFWDQVHPTRVIHKVLSEEMNKFIEANFKVAS